GEKKAIIFSTHILEEVDAVCSRAIIIDQGKVVANGTPAELRQKSEIAGAVTLQVRGVDSAAVSAKLRQVPLVNRVNIVEEKNGAVTVRAFPKSNNQDGALARAIGEAAHGWQIEQLKTEEGRLDEVFHRITIAEIGVKSETQNRKSEI
ncbi:MAG: ABC transporter ATP-binding protein, partial [Limisphaerales bacterium]